MLAGHRTGLYCPRPAQTERLLLVAASSMVGYACEIGKYQAIDAELSIVDDIPKVTAIAPVVDTVLGLDRALITQSQVKPPCNRGSL